MEHIAFNVWKRPQVYWDPDLESKNLEYLKGINPSYYSYIAETHAPCLQSDSRDTCLNAATVLRIAYGQGLETLFSLLCATMQAPACVVGWMQQYRNHELAEMVAAIGNGRAEPFVLSGFRPTSWEAVSRAIYERVDLEAEDRREFLIRGFARLWDAFAGDFGDERTSQEYNALKHGSRPKMGGFSMAIGLQDDPGVPAKSESMVPLGGSKYGSTFFIREDLASRGLHARPRRVSLNWLPENLIQGLEMITLSLTNVSAYLRCLNGDDREACQFFGPDDEETFMSPWALHPGLISSSFDTRITAQHIHPFSKQDALEMIAATYSASA